MSLITQSALLKALGWSLVNSIWQMALLWLVYIILTGIGKRFTARMRHALALIFSTAGSLWFLATFIATLSNGNASAGQVFFGWAPNGGLLSFLYSIKLLINTALPYLSSAYLATLLFLFIRYAGHYVHLQQVRLSGTSRIGPELRLFAASVSRQMGIRKKVAVWLSAMVDSPMTIGFLKPIILIPVATVNHLTTEQVETILLHELAHIKRNDYLINLFISITEIVFFFNPFSRLFIHTIKKEREHCCDDLVMQFQYHPHTYASALLSLEKTRHQHYRLAIPALGKNSQLLLERIKRVTGHAPAGYRYSPKWMSFFLFTLLMGFTFLLQPRKLAYTLKEPARQISRTMEIVQKVYTVSLNPPVEKNKKKNKSRLPPPPATGEKNIYANIIKLTTSTEPESLAGEGNQEDPIVSAVQQEIRDYSIASPEQAVTVQPSNAGRYPFVPSSSFSFQIMVDSSRHDESCMNHNEKPARQTMEEALHIVNSINWSNIGKELDKAGLNVDLEKLRRELRKSIRKLDWSLGKTMCEADEKRIRENIQLRKQALQSIHIKDQHRALELQQQIKEDQLQLQQESLKKQIELIRQEQEEIRKKFKVIYI